MPLSSTVPSLSTALSCIFFLLSLFAFPLPATSRQVLGMLPAQVAAIPQRCRIECL